MLKTSQCNTTLVRETEADVFLPCNERESVKIATQMHGKKFEIKRGTNI